MNASILRDNVGNIFLVELEKVYIYKKEIAFVANISKSDVL